MKLFTHVFIQKHFLLMGGLGRFPWKQTNIRGLCNLNMNALMERCVKGKMCKVGESEERLVMR